jgi:four helix bundle protein
MAPITRFEDVEGWRKSLELQQMLETAPVGNAWLRDQMWRCTNSAMANIAEGFDSGTNPDFVRFLNMAYRSLTEFQSHLYCCKRTLSTKQFDSLYSLAGEAKSKVGGFIRYLKAHPRGRPKNGKRRSTTKPKRSRTRNSARTRNPELGTHESGRGQSPAKSKRPETTNSELGTNAELGTRNS